MHDDGRLSVIRVWDFPTRAFHWLLVASVATAATSGFLLPVNWLNLHLVAGSAIAFLLAFRLAWGLAGPHFSRFRSFMFSPSSLLHYVRQLLGGKPPHFTGHNPLGGAMIFALLGALLVLVATGTLTLGGLDKQGPLRAVISYSQGQTMRQLHELAAFGLLLLIAGHLSGVVVESIRTRINLPRTMVTGFKPGNMPNLYIAASPLFGLLAFSAVVTAIALPSALLWTMQSPMTPSQPLDDAYAKACGDCHIPFHPSLRTASQWTAIMTGLSDHFGEDASLPADQSAAILGYLAANSAEHWDTRAANVFRTGDTLRMTETNFWTRRHGDIAPAIFTSRKVGAKSNCEACHADARSGLFSPQAISIPKEQVP